MNYLEVHLGNDAAIEAYRDPTSDDPDRVRYRHFPGEHVTSVGIPEGYGLQEALAVVAQACDQSFAEGAKPAWIECSNDGLLTTLLSQWDLTKKAKRPRGWGDPEHPVAAKGADGERQVVPKKAAKRVTKRIAASPTLMMLALPIYAFAILSLTRFQLRTTTGRDWQAGVMGNPASNGTGSYAPASWMGVTADNAPPNVGNTTLPGQIAAGTLARKVCAYSHTPGTASYALIAVWTFDQAITLAKFGIFNAATGGTLVFETLLNATVVGVPGDQTTITETVTL